MEIYTQLTKSMKKNITKIISVFSLVIKLISFFLWAVWFEFTVLISEKS